MVTVAPALEQYRIPANVVDCGVLPTSESHHQKFQLIIAALESLKHVNMKALGSSMLPSIWPGDIVLIASAGSEQFEVGAIVVIRKSAGLLIHRLIARAAWLTSRGDAMPQADPPVRPGDVLGKVTKVYRGMREIRIRRQLSPVHRLAALLLCHSQLLLNLTLRAANFWNRRADAAGEVEEISASE